MKVKVVGVRCNMDFSTKEGSRIQGTSLHCVFPAPQTEDFEGETVDKIFLSKFKFPDVRIHAGDEVEFEFDRKGKVSSYEIL